MEKYKIFTFAFLFILNINSNVFAWNVPGDITFIGLEKLSKDVKKTVFSVQTKNDKNEFTCLGTGFLLKHDNLVIGITCFHVVEPILKTKKEISVGLNTKDGFKRFKGKVIETDEDSDIAILVFEKKSEEKIKLENLILDSKYLAENPKFTEGSAVLIPGYPLGIGAKHDQNNPVIRFGIVAQYSEENTFLIDGVANPGNSGSPVFDMKEAKFIGMITSYKNDYINLFNQKGDLIAKLPCNSGLSSAVSSKVITKTLENLKTKLKTSNNSIQ